MPFSPAMSIDPAPAPETDLAAVRRRIQAVQNSLGALHEIADRAVGGNGPGSKAGPQQVPDGLIGEIIAALDDASTSAQRLQERLLRLA